MTTILKKKLGAQLLKITGSLSLLLTLVSSVQAGHGMNNGGDHIRATFIRMGTSVISYLRDTQEGERILTENQLNLSALEQTLSINVIEVVDGLLLDNGGSAVDATGEPGKIRLSSPRWMNHFENDRDVYFLVFHEMLRGIAINDDNYVISKALNPFPQSRRIVTRTTTLYPLLGTASLADIFDPSTIQLTGNGCPSGLAGTFIDFDSERNILEITFNRYDLHVGASDPTASRKACSVVIPYKSRSGQRLRITQMDLTAKVELAPGSQAAIAAGVAFGTAPGPQKSASAKAMTTPIQGRLLVRQTGVYESNCRGEDGLISIQSAATAQTAVEPSMLSADRISISFVTEPCSASLK